MNGFALRLILTQWQKATQKWPIEPTSAQAWPHHQDEASPVH